MATEKETIKSAKKAKERKFHDSIANNIKEEYKQKFMVDYAMEILQKIDDGEIDKEILYKQRRKEQEKILLGLEDTVRIKNTKLYNIIKYFSNVVEKIRSDNKFLVNYEKAFDFALSNYMLEKTFPIKFLFLFKQYFKEWYEKSNIDLYEFLIVKFYEYGNLEELK